ncbi:hypothetical protein ANO14919_022090 [Xylariales sp. No.14919]|nr:hypothetical protein F5X98DRAFT_371498 [Xylaria grammica]GAW12838.1 hypothetical protein ANO14919_022090 [Xylariales sp. No.14919]
MTPPCRVFPASQLPAEVQVNYDGKRRKGGRINLEACELLSMVQYDCHIDRPDLRDSPVRCWPVQRWFRRCQDRKGTFMVETTMWEGRTPPPEPVDQRPRDSSVGDAQGGA